MDKRTALQKLRQSGVEVSKVGAVIPQQAIHSPQRFITGSGQRIASTDLSWSGTTQYEPQSVDRMRFTFPRFVNPMMSYTMFFLPPDRQTLFQWLRFFDAFHPVLGNALDIHVQLPLSRFAVTDVEDPSVMNYYEQMMDDLPLFLLVSDMLRDYWLLGESYAYKHWDSDLNRWGHVSQLMPELLRVEGSPLLVDDKHKDEPYRYFLEPGELMKHLIGSAQDELDDPILREMKEQIPPALQDAAQANEPIEIEPFNLMSLVRRQSGYHSRGTSVLTRVFRHLILESRLMESWYAIADRLINPKELWRVGSDMYPPTATKMSELARMIQVAGGMPMFTMITDHTINYELIGAQSELPDLGAQFDFVRQNILDALFINEAITSGQGVNFSTASISARLLMMRYVPVREQIEEMLIKEIFLPVAVANEFYEVKPCSVSGEGPYVRPSKESRNLILPTIDWRHKDELLDSENMRNFYLQAWDKGLLPARSVIEACGEDYDYIVDALKEEEGTVVDRLYQPWRKATVEAAGKKNASQLRLNFDRSIRSDKLEGKPDKPLSRIARGGLLRHAQTERALDIFAKELEEGRQNETNCSTNNNKET